MSIQHEHLSPLQDDPSLSLWEVVRVSLAQPEADGGHEGAGSARWCGPWSRPARWHDVEAHNVVRAGPLERAPVADGGTVRLRLRCRALWCPRRAAP